MTPHAGDSWTVVDEQLAVQQVELVDDGWFRFSRFHLLHRRRNRDPATYTRYVCERGPRVAVVPFHPEDLTVTLVEQLRLPALLAGPERYVVEAAGGLVDGRSPRDAAVQELLEEVGVVAVDLEQVFDVFLFPVLVAERTHLFVADARTARVVGPGGGLDAENEAILPITLHLDEALRMVRHGLIQDAKTIVLLQHLQLARLGRRT